MRLGPYRAAVVSAGSQPDWYVMFLDGSTRLMPAWEFRGSFFGYSHYTLPPLFWPTVVLPGILTVLPMLYPFLESRFTKDKQEHHLLQRPRDMPMRTGLGAMAVTTPPSTDRTDGRSLTIGVQLSPASAEA